jgi:hypothetical protein
MKLDPYLDIAFDPWDIARQLLDLDRLTKELTPELDRLTAELVQDPDDLDERPTAVFSAPVQRQA